MNYLIRNDLPSEYSKIVTEIANAIEEITNYSTHILTIEKQVKTLSSNINRATISLDKHYKGDHDLRISRLFNSFVKHDPQTTPLKLISSHNQTLEEQINSIPKGKYILVDDDTASGYTIRTVTTMLASKGIDVIETVFLNTQKNFVDIIDASDFIKPEKHEGGLWVTMGSEPTRQGYLTKHVNLESRASILNIHKTFLQQVIDEQMQSPVR